MTADEAGRGQLGFDGVLADRSRIRLDSTAAADFVAAFAADPEVNPHLLAALRRPVKVDWLD